MLIQVRVMSGPALAELNALNAAQQKAAMSARNVGKQAAWGLPWLSKWGNQVQWAGRQLMYNFTLPIALAMGAATKFALENEKAMVRVEKVYGDGGKTFDRLAKKEIPALAEAFEALSNKFGVQQAAVIQIAGDWAAAGATGLALAKSVDLTLQTMVLGELEAVDATKQLIAIQAQYGQSTKQLTKTIEILNMSENETGASMKDLMDAMSRSAGVARTAGIDVEHLAAMTAALVPATGSAATAGNGLKTIISRLLSPTRAAKQVMQEMGVETESVGWNGMSATERLETMAEAFQGLSKAQRASVTTTIASRWQINRFDTLMRDITNTNGYYQKSLRATQDEQKLFTQRQYELNRVLTSNPQMLKQTWVILQNAMARVIVPLLPYIVYLAQQVSHLVQQFSNLSPEVQKLVLAGLVFIAVIGPIARYVGSVTNLFGLLTAATHFLGKAFMWTSGKMLAPLVMLIKFANAPFAKITAGYMLIGKGAKKSADVTKKAFAGTAIVSALSAMYAQIVAFAATMFKPLMASFAGFRKPFVAAWHFMMLQLTASWAWMQRTTLKLFAPFKVAMIALKTSLMTSLAAVVASGGALISAAWAAVFSRSAATVIVARASILTIWASMMTNIRTMITALGTGITAAWVFMHKMIVAATMAASTSIKAIWAMTVTSGKAFVTGLAGIFQAAGLVIMGFFRKLPLIVFSLWTGLWRGILAAAPVILRAMTGPVGLAITAVIGLLYAFRDQVADAWNSIIQTFNGAAGSIPSTFAPVVGFFQRIAQGIVDAFWSLPAGVRDAMLAVLSVIQSAALAAYEWMSYLNPFATHSPSLVTNVTKGMDEIGKQYARAKSMGGPAKQLHAQMEKGIKNQEKAVDSWKNKLDAANDALDRQQDKLGRLQDALSAVQEKYDAHKDKLQEYASAPIKGMGRMEDQIFRNEMAQKKLRLEMLKMGEAGNVDKLRSRLDALYGDIEQLRGRANELRMGGAGSDILGPINAEIAKMEAQAKAVEKGIKNNPANKLQEQLDKLQQKGEILDLEKSIKFDPLIRNIDKLANSQKALSYEQIVNGIKREKAAMAGLQPRLNALNAAIKAQEGVVKKATTARDAIQDRYDREQKQLGKMKDRYDDLSDSMEKNKAKLDALKKKQKEAEEARKKAKAAGAEGMTPVDVENFRNAAGGNWPDPGGFQKIGREGGMGDQSQMIRDFAEQTNNDMAKMFGTFDMFAPLKRGWNRVWGWLKENVGPVVGAVGGAIAAAVDAIPSPFGGAGDSNFAKGVQNAVDTAADILRTFAGWIGNIVDLFADDFKRIWDAILKGGQRVWKKVGPEVAKFGELFEPLGKALKVIWMLMKPVIAIIGVAFLAALKVAASVISRTFGPVLDFLIDTFAAMVKIVRGTIEIILGIITGDFSLIKKGMISVITGAVDAVVGLFKGLGRTLWGIVSGIVMGVVDFFKWLYNVLVGNSIVPDMIDAIFKVFRKLVKLPKWVWNNVLRPIYNFFVNVWKKLIGPFLRTWFNLIKGAWKVLFKVAGWVWDKILKPVFNFFKDLWRKAVGPFLRTWFTLWKGAWKVLFKVAKWVWDNILKPIWNWIVDLWKKYVGPALRAWWKNWTGAWRALFRIPKWVWDNILKPVWNKFKDMWQGVEKGFTGFVKAVGNAWDKVRNAVKKPINGVITIVNTGIISPFNWIADKLGSKTRIKEIKHLATGGKVDGYSPSKTADNIPAWLTAKEHVIRVKAAEKLRREHPGALEHINKYGKLPIQHGDHKTVRNSIPRYAVGGGVNPLPGGRLTNPHSVPYYGAWFAGDYNKGSGFDDLGARIAAWKAGRVARAHHGGEDGSYGNTVSVNHGNQWTRYAHMQRIAVRVGQQVAAGQTLGTVGHSGTSSPHLHFEIHGGRSAVGPTSGGGGGGGFSLPSFLESLGSKVSGFLSNLTDRFSVTGLVEKFLSRMGNSTPAKIVSGMPIKLASMAIDRVKSIWSDKEESYEKKFGGSNPGALPGNAVTRWRGVVAQALREVGGKQSIVPDVLRRIDQESGGNPRIVNDWDSNWQAGHPSVGLMQVIGPTFRSYAGPYRNRGPFLYGTSVNPMANVYAGLNYAKARYPSIEYAMNKPGGYANGAIFKARAGGQYARVAEGGYDEAVVPLPRNWRTDAQQSGKSGGDTVIQINGDLSFPNIKSGSDAKTFIKNIELLAKD